MKKLFTNLLLMLVLGVGGAWADDVTYTTTWSRTFDDSYGISEFTNSGFSLAARSSSDATQVARALSGTATNSLSLTFPSTTFQQSKTYKFSFDIALSTTYGGSGNKNSNFILCDKDGTQIFKIENSGNTNALNLYMGTSTTAEDDHLYAVSCSGKSGANKLTNASTWYTVTVSADETNGTIVTFTPQFTQDGYSTITKTISSDVVYVGNFSALCGKNYGSMWLDNFKLEQVVSDYVAAPTFNITAVNGKSRTLTLDTETEGASIKYSETAPADNEDYSSWTAYSTSLSTTAATIYAVAYKGTTYSTVNTIATTAGSEVTLAAPTFKQTAYSDGNYTIEITSDQSSVQLTPTATIMYSINGGTEQDYSSAVSVKAGSTISATTSATGYTSASSTLTTTVLPQMTQVYTQNYAGLVESNTTIEKTSEGVLNNGVAATAGGNYVVYSADGETAASDKRIGFEVYYNSSSPRKWMIRSGGMYNYTAGNSLVGIANLTEGQIIKVENSGALLTANSGLERLDALCCEGSHYYTYFRATADGTGSFNVGRNYWIYSVTVYDANEIVGALDFTTNYFTTWNKTAVQINKGETAYYKFINHNMGSAAASYQNWYLFVANTSSENKTVLRADAAVNVGGGTVTANDYKAEKVNFATDLTDATVELFVTYKEDGTLVSTAKTTKANGETLADYIYTQEGYTDTPLNVYVSVEKNWLEVLAQGIAVEETSSANLDGYKTFYDADKSYVADANTTIYTAANPADSKVVITEQTDKIIPAGTPVILKTSADDYKITLTPTTATSSNDYSANALKAATSAGTISDAYILAYTTANGLGFYKFTGSFAVGEVYLPATAGAKKLTIVFDDATTAINAVSTVNAENNVRYNLAGQRVSANTKGIVIINGKKYIK